MAFCEFTDNDTSASSSASYTFSGKSLGTAADNRYIIVACGGTNFQSGSETMTGCTMAGETGTEMASAFDDPNNLRLKVYGAAVPTGTTGDIVVTCNTFPANMSIAVYAVYGLEDLTPTDVIESTGKSDTIDVTIGGDGNACVIAMGLSVVASSFGWTGVTEDFEQVVDSNVRTSAGHANLASDETGRAISYTNPDGVNEILVGVSLTEYTGASDSATFFGSNF